jgi:serine/threonine-protein kinase
MPASSAVAPVRIGRYALHDEIASGGMGTVHLGRLVGAAGFSRIVAIKRLNPMLAKDPEFLAMFLDEARLAGRVRHPNVVPTFDVVTAGGEVLLVMEYVHGESLSRLLRLTAQRGSRVTPATASAVMSGVLYGLHAAHEASDERGEPLGLVHRDVSPQNVLVGADGAARVVDFGVAKATGRIQTTREGRVKGKLGYMPPEQLHGQTLDRRADVYAAGVVLWEILTGERLFRGENEANTVTKVLHDHIEPPSARVAGLPAALDALVLRALSRERADRFSTAREMGGALLDACPPAPPHSVGEWVEACAFDILAQRAARVAELESQSSSVSVSAVRPSGGGEPSEMPRSPDASLVRHASEAVASQVSSISVSRPQSLDPPRKSSRARLAAALGGAAAVGAIVVGWRLWPTASPPPVAAVAVEASASAAATATASGDVPPAAPSVTASAAGSVAAPTEASSPAHVSSAPRPAAVPARPQRTPRPDCNPPYVRAADGRKMWKRECLGSSP